MQENTENRFGRGSQDRISMLAVQRTMQRILQEKGLHRIIDDLLSRTARDLDTGYEVIVERVCRTILRKIRRSELVPSMLSQLEKEVAWEGNTPGRFREETELLRADVSWDNIVRFIAFASTLAIHSATARFASCYTELFCTWTTDSLLNMLGDWFDNHPWEEFCSGQTDKKVSFRLTADVTLYDELSPTRILLTKKTEV